MLSLASVADDRVAGKPNFTADEIKIILISLISLGLAFRPYRKN